MTRPTALHPGETPAAFVERCAALGVLGAEHICVITRTPWTDADLARLGEGARLLAA